MARLQKDYHDLAPHLMVLNSIRTPQTSGSGVFPALVLVQGNEQKNIVLNRTPFSVGRKVDKESRNCGSPRVARSRAYRAGKKKVFFLLIKAASMAPSLTGTNSAAETRAQRPPGFGARDSAYAIFNPAHATSNTAREFLRPDFRHPDFAGKPTTRN